MKRMAYRLALALGWPSVAWGLAHISSPELTGWIEYYKLEPFGEERADLRAGIIAATMANAFRDEKSPPFQPRDFMPYAQEDADTGAKEEQGWEEMLAVAEMLNGMYGGADKRGVN